MKVKDLTNAQLMILCRQTVCEECDFFYRYTKAEWKCWECRLLESRNWKENEASRKARTRGGIAIIRLGRIDDPSEMPIPKAWERLLEAEHQLMLTLLEEPK